jgi:twinkle protein
MKTFDDFGISLPARSSSGQVNTQCPRCSSQRRKKKATCLSVNIDEGVWLCHHCGWSGNLANGSNGDSNVLHWRKPKFVKPDPLPQTTLSPSIIKWFSDRGISESTLDENKISEKKVYMPQIEDMSKSVAFPYYKNGELINSIL